jgi:thymidine kinase
MLIVIHGSMFAGKTETMIDRLRRAESEGKTVLAFKHEIDDRYEPDHLVTHRGGRFHARRVSGPERILELCDAYATIAVDEAQFFGTGLLAVVEVLLGRGQDVYVAGITHDAWGRAFQPVPELARRASEVVLLQAPCCVCGAPAPYTQRMAPVTTARMVGGLDEYEPRCARHFVPLTDPPGVC